MFPALCDRCLIVSTSQVSRRGRQWSAHREGALRPGIDSFGYAHFANVKGTAGLVPGWLPWHVGWAYFTGATFIAASVAVLFGVYAQLAAALSALQMGMFALLVWIPILAAGNVSAFQWGEFATTLALTASGWVVADSYRGISELAMGKQQGRAALTID